MGYIKNICALSLAGSLVMAAPSVEASNNMINMELASSSVIDPYSEIPLIDGETSVGLQVIDPLPQLAFEVPLYVTMAVTDTNSNVVVPNNYGITNLSTGNDGSGLDVAVVRMNVTPRSTQSYWNFITGDVGNENDMELTIGGTPVVFETGESSYLDLTNSVFYDSNVGKYIAIGFEEQIMAPVVGLVQPAVRTVKQAVAQFSIRYTVSQLDNSGNPVGAFYEGAYPEGYVE